MTTDPSFTYREVETGGGNPVHLVVLLYDQLIQDLRHALTAMQNHSIEARTCEVDHALLVIRQLQGSLDMENGGEVASNLHNFYTVLRSGLLKAQMTHSLPALKKQMTSVIAIREAWAEVERTMLPAVRPPQPSMSLSPESTEQEPRKGWQA
jgi:flagellar protein FliS